MSSPPNDTPNVKVFSLGADATKPLELITANIVNRAAAGLRTLPPEAAGHPDVQPEAIALPLLRTLLCDIAHEGGAGLVIKALAALGAPSTTAEVAARIRAAMDAQAAEAGTVTAAAQAASAPVAATLAEEPSA